MTVIKRYGAAEFTRNES